jgi:hypothetical protein
VCTCVGADSMKRALVMTPVLRRFLGWTVLITEQDLFPVASFSIDTALKGVEAAGHCGGRCTMAGVKQVVPKMDLEKPRRER